MTEFSAFMHLQGITLGDSWLGGVSLKDYKIILGDFHCAIDKMDRAGENEI